MYRNRATTAAAAARITLAASASSISKVNSSSIYLQYLSPSIKTLNLFKYLTTNAQRSDFYNNETLLNSHQNSYPNPNVGQDRNLINGYPQNPNQGGGAGSPQFQQNTNVDNYRGNYREFGHDRNFPNTDNGYSPRPNGVYGDARPSFHNSQQFRQNPNNVNGGGGSFQSAPVGYSGSQQIPNAWNQGTSVGINGNQSGGVYAGKVVGEFNQSRNGYQFQLNPNNAYGEDGTIRNASGYQVPPIPNGVNIGYQQNPNGMHMGSGNSFAPTNAEPDNGSPQHTPTVEELDAFCRENKVKEAVEMLDVLVKEGIPVDMPRYVLLMQLCANIGVLKYAKSVHDHLIKSTGQINVGVHNKILDMYAKCGSMSDAFKVFDNMTERNLTSWDTMITGLAKNGYGDDAIDLFTQFKEAGLKPDGQMFMGVFLACSVLFDVNEGMLHFESMSKVYGIAPSMDHYVSVVSMLGSAGYLEEAKEFIEKMPVEPNVDVWETLTTICRVHGNTELGDHCEEIVNYLDPSRSVDKSKKGLVPVKDSDIEREVEKKKLSNNLTDVRSKVYEYKAGDAALPQNEKIYALLRGLTAQMKEIGYVPNLRFVLHDVDDETKGEALLSHSERLALAQGVMTSPARSSIRIIKNLRVCGDCHAAMKFASKIIGRQIVMRDAKRFHHFTDGVCSCKDFW